MDQSGATWYRSPSHAPAWEGIELFWNFITTAILITLIQDAKQLLDMHKILERYYFPTRERGKESTIGTSFQHNIPFGLQ